MIFSCVLAKIVVGLNRHPMAPSMKVKDHQLLNALDLRHASGLNLQVRSEATEVIAEDLIHHIRSSVLSLTSSPCSLVKNEDLEYVYKYLLSSRKIKLDL